MTPEQIPGGRLHASMIDLAYLLLLRVEFTVRVTVYAPFTFNVIYYMIKPFDVVNRESGRIY